MAETQQAGQRRVRYKLNENWRGEDSAQIQGINLNRNWTVFQNRVIQLQRVIRTVKNPAGIVDVEEFYSSATDEKVLSSTVPKTEKDLPTTIYSIQHLSSMTHRELMDIARAYGINPQNKKDKILVREILAAQEARATTTSSQVTDS